MALSEVIRTSGDIRRFLAQTMSDIKSENITVERGLAIATLAKEITSSMQAEVNVAKVRVSMLSTGTDLGKITKLGQLLIDDSTPTLSGAADQ